MVWHLDVGSSHPGGEEAPKGLAVRQLKPLSAVSVDIWEDSSLVREDREERTSGVPAVRPTGIDAG